MALTPEEAGFKNDAHIDEQATIIEKNIDDELQLRWHRGASVAQMPAPVIESDWHDEIEAEVLRRFNAAGWKVERQHDPSGAWIFKRAK